MRIKDSLGREFFRKTGKAGHNKLGLITNLRSQKGVMNYASNQMFLLRSSYCRLKNNAQHESCELSFMWYQMRTMASERDSQRALRNCSEEVGGGSVYM